MHFHVRTVSPRQLAGLWSTAMALLPEVSSSYARFERHTRDSEHQYVFRDPKELTRTRLAVRPGEMHFQFISICGAGTDFPSTARHAIPKGNWPTSAAGCTPMATPASSGSSAPVRSARSPVLSMCAASSSMSMPRRARRSRPRRCNAIGALYAVEEAIRAHPPERRAAVRQTEAKGRFDDLERWLRTQLPKLSAKTPLTAAIRYALTRLKRLRPYLEHGFLELDNNAAERALRPIVLGRKNYLFMGSQMCSTASPTIPATASTSCCPGTACPTKLFPKPPDIARAGSANAYECPRNGIWKTLGISRHFPTGIPQPSKTPRHAGLRLALATRDKPGAKLQSLHSRSVSTRLDRADRFDGLPLEGLLNHDVDPRL